MSAVSKNYWNNKSFISINENEKKDLYDYEVFMFRETCKRHRNTSRTQRDRFDKNLLIESIAIHVRVLVDFFYADTKKHYNDLLAQDFLGKDWESRRPVITDLLEFSKNKADKQLAHLSSWRKKLKDDWCDGWNFSNIQKDMDIVINKFEQCLKNKD